MSARVRQGAAGIVALLLLAAVAGCGGSDGPSETALRKKLQAGAQKLTDAKSFHVQVAIEAEEEGLPETIACLNLSLDHHGGTERFDLLFFDQSCEGGSEAHELVAVGHRAWANSSDDPESWAAATITPEALDELDEEQTDLEGLFAAAEDIHSVSEGGAVEEAGSNYVDVTSYDFKAPASAFSGSEDLGDDVDIEFEALLDHKGYLRELTVHAAEDGSGATVSDTYDEIEANLGITPPDPSEVKGPKTKIRSKDDLDRLFGFPST